MFFLKFHEVNRLGPEDLRAHFARCCVHGNGTQHHTIVIGALMLSGSLFQPHGILIPTKFDVYPVEQTILKFLKIRSRARDLDGAKPSHFLNQEWSQQWGA